MESFKKGDAQKLIDKTHPYLFKLVNGKEAFQAMIMQAAKQLIDRGIKIELEEITQPMDFYRTGEDIVCFIPKTSTITVDETKVKSVSFMIAIKSKQGKWSYLDGSGLSKNPDLLWKLLPKLPRDVALPENKKEIIK